MSETNAIHAEADRNPDSAPNTGTEKSEKTENAEEANQNTFADLGLSPDIVAAVNRKGFEEPTPIQKLAIPSMLKNGGNLIAQAQTGTGKTAAFGLPLIELINETVREVQALVLTPTRELAIQVAEEINSLRGERHIATVPIYGGQSIDQQLRRLKKGVHIVVGTPGRVLDHIRRKTLKLGSISHLILDEADEMLNMGFIEDIESIMENCSPDRQSLLFSATMPARIKALAKKYMDGYEVLSAGQKELTTDLTEQIYYEVRETDKFEALCRIIDMESNFYGLVFCRTKSDVDRVASHLIDRGYDAELIHGDVSQSQRERTLKKFRSKNVNTLIATDVAARGIDVDNLSHVINYSLPREAESYVHRIGRTGRAGNEGTAITFITPGEYRRLLAIQRFAGSDIKKSKVPKVSDIMKAKRDKIGSDLADLLETGIDTYYSTWADELLAEQEPAQLLGALLAYSFGEDLDPEAYGKIKDVTSRGSQLDREGKARLFVALGKKDKMSPQRLIKLIQDKVSISSGQIKDIQIMPSFSFLSVPFALAEEIVNNFKGGGRRQLITHARDDRGGGKGGQKHKGRRPSSGQKSGKRPHWQNAQKRSKKRRN